MTCWRKGWLVILVIGLLSMPVRAEEEEDSAAAAVPDVWVARPAPDCVLVDQAERPLRLANFAQPVLVVSFLSTVDAPSQRQLDVLKELRDRWSPRLEVIGIAVQEIDHATLQTFRAAGAIGFPLFPYRYEVVQQFGGLEAIPTTFVIDRNRNIIYQKVGFADEATLSAYARAALESHAPDLAD